MRRYIRRIRRMSNSSKSHAATLAMLATMLLTSTAVAQRNREGATDAVTQGADRPYDLRKLEFSGIHNVQLSSDPHRPFVLHAIGEFSVEGPRVETLRPAVFSEGGVVRATDGELFFYWSSGAGRIDPKT